MSVPASSAPVRLRATFAGVLLVAVSFIAAGPAFADTTTTAGTPPAGPSNNAVAVNTNDGSSVFRLAFSVHQIASGPVVPDNTAIAYASCSSCETVAIAIQLVFVTSPSSYVAPTNAAVAVNYLCTLCQTFAAAVQYVIDVPGPVHFNALGREQLDLIRHELHDLEHTKPPLTEVQAALTTITAQIRTLVASGLVTGHAAHGDQDERATGADAETTTTQVGGLPPKTTTTLVGATTTTTATASATTTTAAPSPTTTAP